MNSAKEIAPPKDRQIRIVANIVWRDPFSTQVDPFTGLARWDERSGDWLNSYGLSIRRDWEAELIILEWEDVVQVVILRDLPYPRRWKEKAEPISMVRALKRLPTALPAPDWMSNANHPFHRDLPAISDAELERRMEVHAQFITYLLDGRGGRAHLWNDHWRGTEDAESKLNQEAGRRWLKARKKARSKSAESREAKKRKVRLAA